MRIIMVLISILFFSVTSLGFDNLSHKNQSNKKSTYQKKQPKNSRAKIKNSAKNTRKTNVKRSTASAMPEKMTEKQRKALAKKQVENARRIAAERRTRESLAAPTYEKLVFSEDKMDRDIASFEQTEQASPVDTQDGLDENTFNVSEFLDDGLD